jgi:hypothetical protein
MLLNAIDAPSRRDRRILDQICASPNLHSSEISPQLARLCILHGFFCPRTWNSVIPLTVNCGDLGACMSYSPRYNSISTTIAAAVMEHLDIEALQSFN